MASMVIRDMKEDDWPSVSVIYAEGIATGMATFEKEVPPFATWDASHLKSCRLVAHDGKVVLGWAALSAVSGRCVYGGVAEVSIYVAQKYRGTGVGRILMCELIEQSEMAGFWSLQSGIFPENTASIRLHEVTGFRLIGIREKIGRFNGTWKDNLLFEKRSSKAGTD